VSLKKAQESVLKTLIYADIFDFPLRNEEIFRRLISRQPVAVQKPIKNLLKEGKINQSLGYFHLPGKEKAANQRKKKEIISKSKIVEAKKIARILKLIPSIKLLAVTGNVAAKNCQEDDDIDFMIVAAANTLWLTRLAIFALLKTTSLLGYPPLRKPKDVEQKDKICLNLFLEENSLKMPPEKQNLFIAYEIALVYPLINRDKTYERFILKNRGWAKSFLPNFFLQFDQKSPVQVTQQHTSFYLVQVLNKLLFKLQLKYMARKKTKEKVSLHYAFFHPRDKEKKIISKFEKKWQALKRQL
jgi:hypothetical protein